MLETILQDLVHSVSGASAAIFLDGDGEAIVQAGGSGTDIRLLGAWKEIHLDRIKEIAGRLKLGTVRAVLFTLDDGIDIIAPIASDYCLLLVISPYANVLHAMAELRKAVELIRKDIL